HAEGGNTVRDHLLSVRNDLKDGAAQCLKRAALRLIETPQVLVNVLGGHLPPVYERRGEIDRSPFAESCFAPSTSVLPAPEPHPAKRGTRDAAGAALSALWGTIVTCRGSASSMGSSSRCTSVTTRHLTSMLSTPVRRR